MRCGLRNTALREAACGLWTVSERTEWLQDITARLSWRAVRRVCPTFHRVALSLTGLTPDIRSMPASVAPGRPAARPFGVVALIAILLAVSGCGDSTEPQYAHDDAASIRLFEGSIDVTRHVPLNSGVTHRIAIRYYNEHGDRITANVEHFDATITFTPSDLATATEVTGSPSVFDIVSTRTGDTAGTMNVEVHHHHTGQQATFGPFDVLVH